MLTPRELKELYQQGKNISAILRSEEGTQSNTEENIEVSYDLQSGSYIDAMRSPAMMAHKQKYTAEIVRIISSLCHPESILEAGVGEATTLSEVIRRLPNQDIRAYGFDLCWSRIAYAKQWLTERAVSDVTLCTGSLFHIPFCDNSVDVVYTSHTIEPNGGNETPILKELYRVARQYLILLEPGYELAGSDARKRMEQHGYCKDLIGVARNLNQKVITHELFPHTANPLNPTAITIIEKQPKTRARVISTDVLACPKFKTPLQKKGDIFFSPEALCVYPVLAGIPCLRLENSIIASHYLETANAHA